MSTPHNSAQKGEIAKTVIMPGDPLRAKYIVENFFDDYKLVNDVRGIYTYTGNYKGKEISVMASGMGMPSMGIYSYELYKFYNVDTIIRIGSCGAYLPDLKLFDIILSDNVFSESNYAFTLNNDDCHIINSNKELNSVIENTAENNNIKLFKGNTVCTDCFDVYMSDVSKFMDSVKDVNSLIARFPKDLNIIGAEMEAFALFYNAKLLNKKASCLMSVVDSKYITEIATTEERQTGLKNMIKLALDSAITL